MDKLLNWIDARFPLTALWESQWGKYVAPKNFNFWYYFGSLATLVLVMQIVTGIFLTMNYKPDAQKAFESVEYIMRDVEWGWLIRYMHSTGRVDVLLRRRTCTCSGGLMYGSYRKPRELRVDLRLPLHHSRSWARCSSATSSRGARCPTGARR